MLAIFDRRKIDPARVMAQSLGDIQLPTFQAATLTALDLLRDPESSLPQIARAIETNPGLVTHILRVVNSAAYGLRQRVDRVSHAISLLGRAQVESLVVAAAVRGGLQAAAPKAAGKRFWQGAAARASLARAFAEVLDPPSQSEAFVTGLLQDMALPLLFAARPQDYRPLLEACAADPSRTLEELERDTFGWDHSTVGACVAHHWALPTSLTEGIGGHHEEDEATAAVHLVSRIRDERGGPDTSPLPDLAAALYGLPRHTVDAAIQRAAVDAAELVQLLA